MAGPAFVLYGVPGWGSVLAEAALAWCDRPYRFEDVTGFAGPGPARDRLIAINPLAQVPTLVLPDGAVLTESAAIGLYLAEQAPDAGLMPAIGHPARANFLRWLVWLVAAVYPTFTYGDYPERWAAGDAATLRAATDAHRERLWRWFETEVAADPWSLGKTFSLLDVYVAAMTRWRPRRPWFAEHCSRLTRIALAADALPKLAPVWRRNFPA